MPPSAPGIEPKRFEWLLTQARPDDILCEEGWLAMRPDLRSGLGYGRELPEVGLLALGLLPPAIRAGRAEAT